MPHVCKTCSYPSAGFLLGLEGSNLPTNSVLVVKHMKEHEGSQCLERYAACHRAKVDLVPRHKFFSFSTISLWPKSGKHANRFISQL